MNAPWAELFRGAGEAERVPVRVVRRHGEPLLIFPMDARPAARAMALYPAQTRFARMARALLHGALCWGVPLPFERAEMMWSAANPLARFIAAQTPAGNCPPVAILAGNPRAAGRRFVILTFAADGAPAAIIKAGLDADARALIAAEARFLESASRPCRGVPTLRARLSQAEVEAFSTDYAPGDSPRVATAEQLGDLLTNWIDTTRTVRADDVPAWRATFANRPLPPMLAALGEHAFHPALFHGDFTPWNIKVHPTSGAWQVLDWERGALLGMPCWDWLHFEIQSAILVRRERAAAVLARLDRLLQAPAFRAYAERAGVAGHERALAAAYLAHCAEVLRPTEGLAVIEDLRHLATTR